MDRQVCVGVIGLGWMCRVHTSMSRRVLDAIERSARTGAWEPTP